VSQLRYVVKCKDGRVFDGLLGVDIVKTIDKRDRTSDVETPQLCYECKGAGGVVVRVFEDETLSVGAAMVEPPMRVEKPDPRDATPGRTSGPVSDG
jgi:hypothetical protein